MCFGPFPSGEPRLLWHIGHTEKWSQVNFWKSYSKVNYNQFWGVEQAFVLWLQSSWRLSQTSACMWPNTQPMNPLNSSLKKQNMYVSYSDCFYSLLKGLWGKIKGNLFGELLFDCLESFCEAGVFGMRSSHNLHIFMLPISHVASAETDFKKAVEDEKSPRAREKNLLYH